MNKERILAIDFGEKNLGFAISDSSQRIALPLKVYRRKRNSEDFLYIKKIVKERNISRIIMGNPINFEGKEGFMSEKVKDFVDELKKYVDVEIILFDERFSTKEAEYYLREYGFDERKMKGKKDSISASIILNSYLESINERK